MAKFVDLIKTFDDFCAGKGVDEATIEAAEEKLGLKFADDYKEYISECGVASADGHEFTGIVDSKRLNVVDVTEAMRAKNPNASGELYVVEDLQTDKVVIWQSGDGRVYKTVYDDSAEVIADSLYDYFEKSADTEE